ncbi:MAG: vitamin K epoxide reductase family protein [Patescibacteria group bacterium]
MKLTQKTHYKVLAVLNFLGMVVSGYLVYVHFEPSLTDFCNLGEQWNCEIVNKSIYAEIAGVPVAAIGFAAYLSFFIFALRGLRKNQNRFIPWYFLVLSGGVAFTLYLTAVESFVLHTYCLFCVTQQIIILIEWAFALSLYKLTKRAS